MEKSQKERMLSGELYMANDPVLTADFKKGQVLMQAFNLLRPDDTENIVLHLKQLLGYLGTEAFVRPTLKVDYGYNISIGDKTFVNYDCVFLDCNKINIGKEVQIAPGVHIYTATHPLDATTRRIGWESALPVTIKDGVWLGGRTVVCPGVTIGENTVVGAGSVVTKDLPPNVLAVGSPCRIVRTL